MVLSSRTPGRSLRRRRGELLAKALFRSWRLPSPALALASAELADIESLLLASGAAGLVAFRLRGSVLESTPAGQRFRDVYRYQVLVQALREKQIAEVVGRFRAAGVEPILGKGWAVARSYPEPRLRPAGDIDLYVRWDDYERARAVLVDEADTLVDLHRAATELDDREEARVFARSRLVTDGSVPVRIFAPEDHLRLVAMHALRHGLIRPL